MNPLDSLEFNDLLQKLNLEMPHHSERKITIHNTPFGSLPKNCMDYSSYRDNLVLNKYQGIIEEILYRDPKNKFSNDFINYQIKYFQAQGILAHDSIFKKATDFESRLKHRLGNTSTSFITFKNGSELLSGDVTIVSGNVNSGTIEWGKASSLGVVGKFYDQIALSINSGTGNYAIGLYDDSSTNPNNLLGQQSHSIAAGFSYLSFSTGEVALTTQQVWLCHNQDATMNMNFGTLTNGRQYHTGVSFGSLPNPATAGRTTDNSPPTMKTSHS